VPPSSVNVSGRTRPYNRARLVGSD
jgi:hypothetical protein